VAAVNLFMADSCSKNRQPASLWRDLHGGRAV